MAVLPSQPLTNHLPLTKGKIPFYLFFILLLVSCSPDQIDGYNSIELTEPGSIRDISFINDTDGYAVGGDIWTHGFIGKTSDAGETWSFDSLTNKVLMSIDESDGRVACGGLDGKIFRLENGNWNFDRTKDWAFIKDLILVEDDILSVGGQAYRFGFINSIDLAGEVDSLWNEDIELQSILRISENVIIAAGYGIILRSENNGASWNLTEGQGDFFKDLCFNDEITGFALGQNGLILKTEDGGLTWSTSVALGDFERSSRMTDMSWIADEEYWAIGKAGKVLKTLDEGASWKEYSLGTASDLYSINAQSEKILIAGENGYFVSINK